MRIEIEGWIAVYAAIVATGALALEIRRWFESGPKINFGVRPNMNLLYTDGSIRPGLIVVTAATRGDAPTTITHLAILEFPTLLARLRRKHRNVFLITRPNPPAGSFGLPFHLEVGKQWIGMVDDSDDATRQFHDGKHWAAIVATHRSRPYLAKIPKLSVVRDLPDARKI